MLKDRRELIERDIARLTNQCSATYLGIIRRYSDPQQSDEYNTQIEKLSNLKTELNLINQLIALGHE